MLHTYGCRECVLTDTAPSPGADLLLLDESTAVEPTKEKTVVTGAGEQLNVTGVRMPCTAVKHSALHNSHYFDERLFRLSTRFSIVSTDNRARKY